jgi:hypothetical protein
MFLIFLCAMIGVMVAAFVFADTNDILKSIIVFIGIVFPSVVLVMIDESVSYRTKTVETIEYKSFTQDNIDGIVVDGELINLNSLLKIDIPENSTILKTINKSSGVLCNYSDIKYELLKE